MDKRICQNIYPQTPIFDLKSSIRTFSSLFSVKNHVIIFIKRFGAVEGTCPARRTRLFRVNQNSPNGSPSLIFTDCCGAWSIFLYNYSDSLPGSSLCYTTARLPSCSRSDPALPQIYGTKQALQQERKTRITNFHISYVGLHIFLIHKLIYFWFIRFTRWNLWIPRKLTFVQKPSPYTRFHQQ